MNGENTPMPERIYEFLGSIPFLLAVDNGDGRKRIKANWARIVEILMTIIAILWFLSSRMDKVEIKLDHMQAQFRTLDDRLFQHITAGRR